MKTTKVLLREEQTYIDVPIAGGHHPLIEEKVLEKWQNIIDLVCQILDIPSGLIMKITDSSMEVFLKSTNPENPYPENGKDTLGHGLYCETVIGRDKSLEVSNALDDDAWNDNPDVALNMISYLGYPIKWPDDDFFGTICVLDNKTHNFSNKHKQLLEELKNAIEMDLILLTKNEALNYYAEMDVLTDIYNRRKISAIAENEFKRSMRNHQPCSVALLDLDNFKYINDTFGHAAGDKFLQLFTKDLRDRIRSTDYIGRWGGDEFLLICPDTDSKGIQTLMTSIHDATLPHLQLLTPKADFSYGCSTFKETDKIFTQAIDRADRGMYNNKDN